MSRLMKNHKSAGVNAISVLISILTMPPISRIAMSINWAGHVVPISGVELITVTGSYTDFGFSNATVVAKQVGRVAKWHSLIN